MTPTSTSVPPTSSDDHLGFLDGIRGGAALWVLFAHCMIWGGWYGVPLPSAKIAVDIFMVASGFLMVYQYRRREKVEPLDARRTALRFWMRRFFRIAPIYYVSLAVIWIFWREYAEGLTALQQVSPESWARNPIYDPANYEVDLANTLVHATFLFGIWPKYAFSNMSPDWSIGLEVQFYVAFPILYFLLRRFFWVGTVVVAVILSEACNYTFARLPGAVPGTVGLFAEPTFLLMKLPLFIIGMLLGEVFCRLRHKPVACALMSVAAMLLTARYSILVSLVAATILWLSWSAASSELEHPRVYRWLHGLLGNRFTAFLADMSYSVYLLHILFISFVGGALFRQPDFLALSPPVRVGILASIICPLVYFVSWVLHQVVEKPGIELGRRVINRYSPPTVHAAGNQGEKVVERAASATPTVS